MSIRDQLSEELKDAMRSKDVRRRDVIRQVQTEIATAKTQPDFVGEVDDAFYQKVIASYVKKMDKSRADYAGYGDKGAAMAEKLAFEVDYLSQWLPKKLDEDRTRQLVIEAVAELGVAGDVKASGRIVGHLMKANGQNLDGSLVNRLVREELDAG